LPCGACRGKGFYICKLCKGNASIHWSPLYDPVAINPCLCPTCDGNRLVVVSCLLCIDSWFAIGFGITALEFTWVIDLSGNVNL